MSDCDTFRSELFPRNEWFVREAQNIMSERILTQYRKRIGDISILDTFLYRDLGKMHQESYNRLLPYLRYQCRLENRQRMWGKRRSSRPPEWITERRSGRDIRPSDMAQMIVNTYIDTIMRENHDRIESLRKIIEQRKREQVEETDFMGKYRVEIV